MLVPDFTYKVSVNSKKKKKPHGRIFRIDGDLFFFLILF